MEQKIKVKHEVGVIIPRLTNPATPEDVIRNKQYLDGQGVVQKGKRYGDRLSANGVEVRLHTLDLITGGSNTTLGDALAEFCTHLDDTSVSEGLVAFSVRDKTSYVRNELGTAVLRRGDNYEPYWEATRCACFNYFDPSTMYEDDPTDPTNYKIGVVPIDPTMGFITVSVSYNYADTSITNIKTYDANGDEVRSGGGGPIRRRVDGEVVRSGWYVNTEGAVTLRFRVRNMSSRGVMVTTGNTGDELPPLYEDFGVTWETIDNLDDDAILPVGSSYDYFSVT